MDPRDVASCVARALRFGVAAASLAAAMPLAAAELEARSSDGRWILRADNAAPELFAVDAHNGELIKRITVADKRGVTSRVARLLDAPPRASFIVLLADIPEAWELSYDPRAEPVFEGLVHDYRMGEGIAASGPLPVRRVVLDVPMTDALFEPRFDYMVGAAAGGRLHVVNLNVRRRIEIIDTGGDPRPAQGAVWQRDRTVFLIPDSALPRLLVLDARTWRLRKPLELPAVASSVRVDGDAIAVDTASGVVQLRIADLRLD